MFIYITCTLKTGGPFLGLMKMPSINFLDCTLDMIEAAEIFAGHMTEVLAHYEQVFRKIISLIMAGRVYNWLKTNEFSVFSDPLFRLGKGYV